MIDIKATIDKQGITDLHKLAGQIPFAMRLALNRTAKQIHLLESQEIGKVFDKPTPFAKNSLKYTPCTKDGELIASVESKPAKGNYNPADFLHPEIQGGGRTTKRFEARLISAGIMPADCQVMPFRKIKLDFFGNIPRRIINKMMKALPLLADSKNGISKKNASGYRAVTRELKLADGRVWPKGIYAEGARGTEGVVLFVKRAQYKPRFNFYTLGEQAADRILAVEFDKALAEAMRTAR